ncbi:MAG: type I methionyl aminopeptidase [Spartobacteria bacterium]|nr:type I methionyl aminopeptidase [Spartobacteria bacterium]
MRTGSSKHVGRNDPCPCGSGLKFKKCCMLKRTQPRDDRASVYFRKHGIHLKGPHDVEGIRKAGVLVLQALDLAEQMIAPGVRTEDINTLVHDFTIKNNAIPAPLDYQSFPKSVCISINDVICHGIPGERRLQDGDIVNVDVTTILDGYYADANKTFFVGTPGPDARKIVRVARECLRQSIGVIRPGGTIGDIGWAIQQYAEAEGCSVVREFVGHGVGFEFHEAPQIAHYGRKGRGVKLVPGMVFTVEPMINLGRKDLYILDDKWTAMTKDGSLSAQFEQTLLVTPDGVESLTPFDLSA